MKWLAEYDEGPDVGGDKGPYRWPENELQEEYAEKLVEKGEVFPYCFVHPRDCKTEERQVAMKQALDTMDFAET